MNSSNAMTREELLEHAALDAFALLDEYETALYARSFHNAPAAVQDQIIQLQAQLVSDESLLPDHRPASDLRDRVLYAVASAIEQETAELEPLATIGRSRPVAEPVIAGRIGGTSQFWRAAAFALCAGLIVGAYFLVQISSQSYQIAAFALTNNTNAQLEDLIGPTFKEFLFNPSAQRVVFEARQTAGTSAPKAAMYMVEDSSKAFLVIENLPQTAPSQPYTLAMKDAAGNVETVHEFDSAGKLSGMHVALTRVASRLRGASWEIRSPAGTLLASL